MIDDSLPCFTERASSSTLRDLVFLVKVVHPAVYDLLCCPDAIPKLVSSFTFLMYPLCRFKESRVVKTGYQGVMSSKSCLRFCSRKHCRSIQPNAFREFASDDVDGSSDDADTDVTHESCPNGRRTAPRRQIMFSRDSITIRSFVILVDNALDTHVPIISNRVVVPSSPLILDLIP